MNSSLSDQGCGAGDAGPGTKPTTNETKCESASINDFSAKALDGTDRHLSEFSGQVLLIVNVASKCGFTGQYSGLEALYQKFKARGLVILGFPCNQFGGQEPGDDQAIQNFCSTTYGVTFPMFSKVEVNGDRAHPLYRYLKHHSRGVLGTESIKWNFTKFLVDRAGKVQARFAPTATPESLEEEIEKLL